MNNSSLTQKRKSLLINPKFQMKFLSYFLIIAGFTFILFLGAKVFFFYNLKKYLLSVGLPENHTVFSFLDHQSLVMDVILIVAGLIECVALIFIGLKISNQIAGPLHRLNQHMKSISDGSAIGPVTFRKDDFFSEIAESYNKHAQMLSKRDSN